MLSRWLGIPTGARRIWRPAGQAAGGYPIAYVEQAADGMWRWSVDDSEAVGDPANAVRVEGIMANRALAEAQADHVLFSAGYRSVNPRTAPATDADLAALLDAVRALP